MPQGASVPGMTARERAIRQVVYQRSKLNAVGMKLIPEQKYGNLEVQFDYPGEIMAVHGIAPTDVASRQNISWSDFNMRLKKGQVRFLATDAAAIQRIAQATNKINIQRASEAMAIQKDYNILNTLQGGVTSAHTITAGTKWTDAASDAEQNIVDAWAKIIENSNIQVSVNGKQGLQQGDQIFTVVPAKSWAPLNSLQLINNVQQSLLSYVAGAFQLEFYITRTPKSTQFRGTWPLVTKALMGVKGELTAIHGVYDDSEPSVPMVEETRVPGVGYDYIVTQYYESGIIEDGEAGTGKNYRLAAIDGVA